MVKDPGAMVTFDKPHSNRAMEAGSPLTGYPEQSSSAVQHTPANATTSGPTGLINGQSLLIALVLYSVLVLGIFHDTVLSMVAIWQRSETFAHGFFILPISLWLVWRMRHRFSQLTVTPQPLALLPIAAAGLAWLLANLVDVLVIQQLAFVTVLVSGIWAIAGTEVTRYFAFPLGFLYLAVPMGEGLIPPLMEFTADTTEYFVRASGVPLLREGMFLILTTGTWSVIEECSGVRYLIASVTLGLCYAHITYTSIWRKLAFVAFAVILPILANSVRAYIVVMVGHLSNMRYGIGADHLIFGWVFFGIVMLFMFWVGSFWQQDDRYTNSPSQGDMTTARHNARTASLVVCTSLALACTVIGPTVAALSNRSVSLIEVNTESLVLPPALGPWRASTTEWQWRPAQPGADRALDAVYSNATGQGADVIGVHLRQYLQQQQGAELVNEANPWRPDRRIWQIIDQRGRQVALDGGFRVVEARLTSVRQNLLVWSWYRIDGQDSANPYVVKLLEAKQQLLEGRRRGTRVFLATPATGDIEQARRVLREFLSTQKVILDNAMEQGLEGTSAPDRVDSEGSNFE